MSAGDTLNGHVSEDEGSADALARAESDVKRARERVTQSMMALRNEVARQVDWKSWVQRRPMVFVGGALVLGFWLGNRR